MHLTQKQIIDTARKLVQPLLSHFHKGQAGRICVVGGCSNYAGAPYFAAHAAATIGADLVHIVCGAKAGPIIQLFLPDLMVHPVLAELRDTDLKHDPSIVKIPDLAEALYSEKLRAYADEHIMPQCILVLDRTDLVVLGPGLGRDPLMMATAVRIIEETKVRDLPLLLDADGLYLVSLDPKLILTYPKAIVTPNVAEFSRLANAVGLKEDAGSSASDTTRLSRELGNALVVRKGPCEIIAKGDQHLHNTVPGLLRRVGGQGDTLAGTLACLLNWLYRYASKQWDVDEPDAPLLRDEANLVAAAAGCAVVRTASRMAFEQHGRLMQTSHVHEQLHRAFCEVYGD